MIIGVLSLVFIALPAAFSAKTRIDIVLGVAIIFVMIGIIWIGVKIANGNPSKYRKVVAYTCELCGKKWERSEV
jgi:hypothetical protein